MKRKLLFIVTEDWYFWMHRLPQARAAREAGYMVSVATRVTAHAGRITGEGFSLIPLSWRRGSLNPFAALRAVFEIAGVCRQLRPDLVHNVALKAILLGTLGARLGRARTIINGFTGLGQLFLGNELKIRILRLIVFPLLRLALKSSKVFAIVENKDHLQVLLDKKMLKLGQGIVIRGSGVDTHRFPASPEPPAPIIAACAARLLRSKGILVLAQAMQIVQERGSTLRLHLAGTLDAESSDSLSQEEMASILRRSNITCMGHIDDMPGFWQNSHIGVLVSLTGEGLPVSLLEAAATGRALIASDVAGCREIVIPEQTGVLVPPADATALADALLRLEGDGALRNTFAIQSRLLVERELSGVEVGRRTIEIYGKILIDAV